MMKKPTQQQGLFDQDSIYMPNPLPEVTITCWCGGPILWYPYTRNFGCSSCPTTFIVEDVNAGPET